MILKNDAKENDEIVTDNIEKSILEYFLNNNLLLPKFFWSF